MHWNIDPTSIEHLMKLLNIPQLVGIPIAAMQLIAILNAIRKITLTFTAPSIWTWTWDDLSFILKVLYLCWYPLTDDGVYYPNEWRKDIIVFITHDENYDKGLDSKGGMVDKIFLAHSSAIKQIVWMSLQCTWKTWCHSKSHAIGIRRRAYMMFTL